MTDDELKALVASLSIAHKEMLASNAASKKELDLQLAKTDAQLAKTTEKLDRLGELVGNISNNQGDIAEEFFYRSFTKNPSLGDIRFDSLSRNLNNRLGDLEDEYDLVLVNGDSLAIIEVKAKVHIADLEKLVHKKIPNFPKLFKVYRDYHLYAGIATLATYPELIHKAKELGLFLITQQGDHASVVQAGRLLH